jgi:hypothetical protein
MKYFLKQQFSSLEQHTWLTKMLGCDYEIIYKKGKEKVVVDALCRQFEEDRSPLALSLPSPICLEESHKEWLENNTLWQLIQRL